MKKIILASAVVTALTAGSAFAAQNVTFVGSVLNSTCNLEVGGPDAQGIEVPLGQVNVSTTGANAVTNKGIEKVFTLKPAGGAACTVAGNMNKVAITWHGDMNGQGLTSKTGATDSYVTIKTDGGDDDTAVISLGNNVSSFAKDKLNSADGLKFKAQLVAGTQEGAFSSPASFTLSYN